MATEKINIIPTFYNGILYRSRTEARWAVFFDKIGVRYNYEAEGYSLKSGWYLPDFQLYYRDSIVFAEVKGSAFTCDEKRKCTELCESTNNSVILLDGAPDFKEYTMLEFSLNIPPCQDAPHKSGLIRVCLRSMIAELEGRALDCLFECGADYVPGVIETPVIFCNNHSKYYPFYVWPCFPDGRFDARDWDDEYANAVYMSLNNRFGS